MSTSPTEPWLRGPLPGIPALLQPAARGAALGEARAVGCAQLPSTVFGRLRHAAHHASRHTGQIVTTARLVRAIAEAQAP